MITGKDLINAGLTPGPRFKAYLDEANQRIARGESWETIQREFVQAAKATPPKLTLRDQPLSFAVASQPETEAEQENIAAAKQKMAELSRVPVVERAALMPDTCPSGSEFGCIPVGGAIVTGRCILPAAHSADICCSMFATVFPKGYPIKGLMDALGASTLFGPYARQPGQELNHAVLDEPVWSNPFLKGLESHAQRYLGTQGDGNHFAYIGELSVSRELIEQFESAGYTQYARDLYAHQGEDVQVLVTHHGSRNLGAQLYKRGMDAAKKETEKVASGIPKTGYWLNADTPIGQQYWEALQYIGRWTKANHSVIHEKFLQTAGLSPITQIQNEHNFVWEKDGVFYHGKGATPAWTEQGQPKLGIIPLNMGHEILLVLGKDNQEYLSFAPHGAGRNQSRSATIRPFIDPLTQKPDPVKVEKAIAEATAGLDIRWGSGKPDISESPFGYKDANAITRQIQDFSLATVIASINPKGCMMAGEFPTPWKEIKDAKRKAKEAELQAEMDI